VGYAAGRALAIFTEAGIAGTKWSKNLAARGSTCFAGLRPWAQRSISAESVIRLLLIFIGAHYRATLGLGYICGDKSNWPSRGQERVYDMPSPLYSLEIASFLAMTRGDFCLFLH
jgi:hypothetical protein